jgi:hypothetical protein
VPRFDVRSSSQFRFAPTGSFTADEVVCDTKRFVLAKETPRLANVRGVHRLIKETSCRAVNWALWIKQHSVAVHSRSFAAMLPKKFSARRIDCASEFAP